MADSNEDLQAALRAGLSLNPPVPDPTREAYDAAADLFMWFLRSAIRIIQYARLTCVALREFEDRGFEHLKPTQWSIDDKNSMAQVLVALNRKSEVDFLKQEGENAEAYLYGQTAVSLWGTLEVYFGDLLFAVVKHEPSRITKIASKAKMRLSDFYSLDEDRRIEQVLRLVAQDLGSSLKRGVGAFESMLNAFGLGDGVDSLASETILEFSAVRNCLVHRKGIVDARFTEYCGTSSFKLGEEIRLTASDVYRYFYAAAHYAASVVDRVQSQCQPGSTMDFRTNSWLEDLKKAQPGPT